MKNMKIKILALGSAVLMLASCLKEGKMNTDPSTATNVIELANTTDNIAPAGIAGYYIDLGVLGAGDSAKFNINVHYTGPGTAPNDITVTLAKDSATLATYNTTNGTSKVAPVATVVKFPSTVVIKKGTSQTTVQATVTLSSDFNFNAAYALPIKISAVSSGVISGNFGASVYSFGVRNKYDGVYQMRGYHTRSPYNYPYNVTMEMRTLGATSVGYYWPDAGAFGHPIGIGPNNSLSWYGGAVSPVVVFDPATNLVTNIYNQAGSPPISIYTAAGSGQGRQDQSTKTMYLYWRYNANDARGFLDTLTYLHGR
jgi:hypothetical protein